MSRAAFEKWFLSQGNGHAWLDRTEEDTYYYADTQQAWDAWQAAAARAEALVEAVRLEYGGSHYDPECPLCVALAAWEEGR